MKVSARRRRMSRPSAAVAVVLSAVLLVGSTQGAASADPAAPTPTPTTDTAAPSDTPTSEATAEPSDAPTTKATPAAKPPKSKAAAEPKAAVAPQVVPAPPANSSVITVKVGGDRTGTQSVAPLAGVVLELYAAATGGTALFTCTSDADGDCSVTIPNTQVGGANRNARYWVRQKSAPGAWFTNPVIRTGESGGNTSAQTPYTFRTGASLQAGMTYRSTNDFMIDSGASNASASGGIWQQSRNNPVLPSECGLDVGLILDLSGSVGDALPNLKAAANTFTNALVGTPSRMSLFSFSTVSPASGATQNYPALTSVSTQAGADAFKARYTAWTSGGTTNWDRGIETAAVAADKFDVAVIITDGNPTVYNQPAEGPGGNTRIREVENGIFSANALKSQGTRILAFGVGGGASGTATALNLRAISGGTAFNGSNGATADYYQTKDYAAVGTALRNLALGNCKGSVSVTKQIVPSGNTGEDVSGALPAGAGWQFAGSTTTSGVGGLPSTQTTTGDGTGTVNFPLLFPGGTTSAAVNVKETQQAGYTLVAPGGKNAACKDLVTGLPIATLNDNSDAAKPGFNVVAPSTNAVSCTVYNRAPKPPANITVSKKWVVNGTSYADGSQPDGLSAQLSLTGPGAAGATPQGWGVTRSGYSVGDKTTVSETTSTGLLLCTLDSSRVTNANGATINAALPYSANLSQAANTYTVTNTVTCDTKLTLAKVVQGGNAAPTLWTLNAIAPSGALPGPTGATGSDGASNVSVTPSVTYQLAESGGDPNYTQVDNRTDLQTNPRSTGSMNCIQIDAAGNQIPGFADGINGGVRVPIGTRVKCTATNITAPLLLIKRVVNTNGGTAVPSDWNLTATPTGTPPAGVGPRTVVGSQIGVLTTVRPGQPYQLTETGPTGYALQSLMCTIGAGTPKSVTSITLEQGQTGTCTYTNVDQPAKLTLRKIVDANESGSGKVPADWTLTATPSPAVPGQGAVSGNGADGVTNTQVFAGSYDLSEDGPAGFDAGDWTCTGGVLAGRKVAVPVGGDVTCTITNTAVKPRLTLVKEVTNTHGGTAVPTDWTLAAAGPTPVSGTSGAAPVTSAPVKVGTYSLSESGGPNGYDASAWTCTGATVADSAITLAEGDNAVCTITNTDKPALLTLVKVVDNGATGGTAAPVDWNLAAAGPTPVSGAGNSAAVTNQPVSAGSYALAESGGPNGYTASAWTCTGGTVTGAQVAVPLGGDVTCTITNTAQVSHLTLVKKVDNGTTGATTTPSAWTLTADGPTPVTGKGDSAEIDDQVVKIGSYDLSEDGPAGYTASDWTCVGGTQTAASIAVALGDDVTCTINNTAIAPKLTLVKKVVNTSGGTAVDTDWTLTADGPTTGISGAVGDPAVTAAVAQVGDYDLSESDLPTGYTASDWTCVGASDSAAKSVTLAPGDDATCTITNTDQPAKLTLVKDVDGDAAGSGKVPSDWTLTATPDGIAGQDPVSGNGDPDSAGGVNKETVFAGAYDLTEDGPGGFDPGTWQCTGGDSAGARVTVPSGGDVTCTITNTARAPKLTLVKKVVNDDGGTAVPTDWTLAADGKSPISGATGDPSVTDAAVKVGTYDLSESGPTGYTASDWTCASGDASVPVTNAAVALAEGDDVTCTIVNDDVKGSWTVSKSSDPASGSTVEPGDVITYTVTATKLAGVDPTDVVVTDDLSKVLDNATLVPGSIKASTGSAGATGTTLTWDIPTLSGSQTVTYQVKVNTDAYGVTLKNLVTSTGSEPCVPAGDRVRKNARRAAAAAVECNTTTHKTPKWTLEKNSDPKSGSVVRPGSTVTYTLKATNVSDSPVTNAVVTDDLSKVLDHGSLLAVPNGATLSGTTLTWTVPTLAAEGDTASLTYQVKIDSGAYDVTIKNVATPGKGGTCDRSCSTTHLTPPKTTPPPTNPPVQPGGPNVPGLPGTGGPAGWVLYGGLILVLLGGLVMFVARRRRT